MYSYSAIIFIVHISLCFDVFLKGTRSTEMFFGKGRGNTRP